MADKTNPMDGLKDELRDVMSGLGERAMSTVTDKVGDLTERLTDVADGGPLGQAAAKGGKAAAQGKNPIGGALKGGLSGIKDSITGGGGGGGGGGKATKATIMIEEIDVGVPVSVAYNQWTEYDAWPGFMKKVERAEQEEDEPTTTHKAQIFWSHRSWESTIKEQVPDERIVWRSSGEKGHVDGSVTFHELAPRLTRILVVLEYYPQGLFERTGNLWRAQGRRARLELKHFRRHVMMNTILEPESVEGWRGEIHDEEVERTHDEVVEEEQQDEASEDEAAEDEAPEDEYGEEEAEDYEDEPADEEEYEEEAEPGEEEPEDEEEYEEEPADEEEEYEEEEEEPEDEEELEDEEEEPEEPPRRTRKKSSSRKRK